MNFPKITGVFALVTIAFVAGVPLKADALFHFDYSIPWSDGSGVAVSASGDFVTSNIDPTGTYYTILDIVNGSWNGVDILGLLPLNGFYDNDNILNASAPYLTGNGVSFRVAGVGDDSMGNVNVYFTALGYTEPPLSLGYGTFDMVRVPGTVPEPASLALLGSAAGLSIAVLKRKRQL